MIRPIVLSAALSGVAFVSSGFAAPVSYSREVRPVLSENCFYCHGQDANKRKAELQLNTLAGQRESKAVVPGNVEASELVKRLFSTDEEEMMPPPKSNRHVSPEQKELLKRWVEEGAVFEDHWTFVPPVRPALPAGVQGPNAIDSLVEAKLTEKGMQFSPEADKVTLLRRIYLDLIGLPPSPEEVDAFVADASPEAYAKAVEKLLGSKHYGERMALPWLDAARFADSNGFQQEGDTHQHIWRDWVINALNADMPFDQFSIEQLAGDLLPEPTEDQLIATAFNRNHMLNGEGGAIAEEQRNVVLFDRVDTTTTNWLGLTVACAQCHDHKYDPITQKDYYSCLALFNNVPESGVPPGGGQYRIADPTIPVASAEEKLKLAAMEKEAAELKQKEKDVAASAETKQAFADLEKRLLDNAPVTWELLKAEKLEATDGVKLKLLEDSSIFAESGTPAKSNYTITFTAGNSPMTGFRIDTIPDSRLPTGGAGVGADSGNAVLTRLILTVDGKEYGFSAASADYTQTGFKPEGVIDKDVNTAWAFYPDTRKPHYLAVQCKEPLVVPAGKKIVLTFEFKSIHQRHLLGRFKVSSTVDPQPASRQGLPANIAAILKKADRTADEAKLLREHLNKNQPPAALAKARDATKAKDKQLQDYRQTLIRVMVMSDKQPRKTFVYDRGSYLTPTKEEVTSNSPAFLPKIPDDFPKNRLGFAKWLFLPEHPLTARVQVNRVWQYFFGTGLVKTSEDLGVQSEVPIHNALLDWLSVEFREKGWSQKHLVRLILATRTYKQSSKVSPEVAANDPENRYMSHASRFRMPSMILRDMALAASGLLNIKTGGLPVYPYQPDSVWENLAITKERDFTYPASHGADLYRRSIYTFWRRTIGPTNMFDASARQSCKVRVGLTSTPLHALTTLNDITWMEAARVLAEKALQANPQANVEAQIAWSFRKVLTRNPTTRDMSFLTAAYHKQQGYFTSHNGEAEKFISTGEYTRDKSLPPTTHAALSAVCLALFNLDEALTRQ